MKAITLYDPWGSLMSIGAKVNETRGCRTSHRGDICIHVAKADHGCSDEVAQAAVKAFQSRGIVPQPVFGCIVAVVDLWDVQPSEKFFRGSLFNRGQHAELVQAGRIPLFDEELMFGNYAPGRFIYRTRNLRRLATPVPCRGFQCVGWTAPPDIAAKVQAQLPRQCSFGAATSNRCQQPPTHVSTFQGRRSEQMFWCAEHHDGLLQDPQTPGHGFEKL